MKPTWERDGIQLYLGDCLEVLPTLGKVDAVFSDPPYGIGLEEHGRNGYDWKIAGDMDQSVGVEVLRFAESRKLPTVFFASPMKPWPGKWRQHLVWDKGPAVGGGGDIKRLWKMDHEIIQFVRTGVLCGQRDSSVLRYWIGQGDLHFHPCEKPVPLLSYLIEKFGWSGGDAVVADPFAGSGSIGVSAARMRCPYIGIEKHEPYFEIAVKRIERALSDERSSLFPVSKEVQAELFQE